MPTKVAVSNTLVPAAYMAFSVETGFTGDSSGADVAEFVAATRELIIELISVSVPPEVRDVYVDTGLFADAVLINRLELSSIKIGGWFSHAMVGLAATILSAAIPQTQLGKLAVEEVVAVIDAASAVAIDGAGQLVRGLEANLEAMVANAKTMSGYRIENFTIDEGHLRLGLVRNRYDRRKGVDFKF